MSGRIPGKRVFLRYPVRDDADEFIAASRASRRFHRGLTYPPVDRPAFSKYIGRNRSEANELFLICQLDDGRITGSIELSQIFHGGFKSAFCGYYLFEEYAGRGYMTEALGLILGHAFRTLKLHRLEANIQPHNRASIELVKRCGFTREGFSRKYLKIGGRWRDHERWAILREDWEASKKNR